MTEKLEIRKGGKLIDTVSEYDEKTEKRTSRDIDVTDVSFRYLFNRCELEEGVTLKDILLVINKCIDFYDLVLEGWCREYVEEGLKGKPSPDIFDKDGHAHNIDYLELYWCLQINNEWLPHPDGPREPKEGSITKNLGLKDDGDFTGKPALEGYSFPDFHGVMIAKEDGDPNTEGWKKGEEVPMGVSFTKVRDLINKPVKLDRTLEIAEHFVESARGFKNLRKEKFYDCEYTLGHILYGIMWELSWNGSIKNREGRYEDLMEASKQVDKDIKAGKYNKEK